MNSSSVNYVSTVPDREIQKKVSNEDPSLRLEDFRFIAIYLVAHENRFPFFLERREIA